MPSNVPALIDYLVELFTADATLGQATPPVTVFDGPPVTEESPFLVLYVGLQDPDNEGIETAASFTQVRGDMGTATRTEDTTVHCVAEAWSGSDGGTVMSTVRAQAFGILAAVEALIRSPRDHPPYGGLGFANPGISAGDLMQNTTSVGVIARVPFAITFKSFT